jgi:ProP effector
LLRAFEGSTLTKANFCALKGVAVEELDDMLELARREADERARLASSPPRPGPGPDRRGRHDGPVRRRG